MTESDETRAELNRADMQMIVQIYVADYHNRTAAKNLILGEIHQLSLSALASMAGIAVLVVALVNISPELLVSVLLFLPFPFTAMMFSYLGHVNEFINIDQYIDKQLVPELNQIINNFVSANSSLDVFTWGKFHRIMVGSKVGWISQGLWAFGQGLLIGFPIIGSLVAFFFSINYAGLSITGWWIPILVIDFILVGLILVMSGVGLYRYGLFR